MKLHNMELINFRNYIKKDFKFDGKCATIDGSNGTGKSSIKEAVLYALYGRDLNGSTRLLDNLIRNGEKQATVSVDFEEYKVTRVKNQSKYIIMMDDKSQDIKDAVVPQRDLDFILPNAELFQSIFDVGYFMTLSENDQRRLLLKHTPSVDRKALWHETYKDGMDSKYQIFFGDYDQERMRHKRLAEQAEQEMVIINTRMADKYINPKEVENLRVKVEELKKKLGATKEEICDKCKQAVRSPEREAMRREVIIAEHELNDAEARLKTQESKLDDHKEKVAELEQMVKDHTTIYKRLSPNGLPAIEADIKLKPIIKHLSKQIEGLKVVTLKRVKTTIDWKECFEIFVGDVPYKRLSTGEKIKVDLAFSEMLNILTDRVVDMYFVDNYESVTGELPQVGGQLFLSRVVDNKDLTVATKGGE